MVCKNCDIIPKVQENLLEISYNVHSYVSLEVEIKHERTVKVSMHAKGGPF